MGQPHNLSWRPAGAGDAEWMSGMSRLRLAPVSTEIPSWMPDRRALRKRGARNNSSLSSLGLLRLIWIPACSNREVARRRPRESWPGKVGHGIGFRNAPQEQIVYLAAPGVGPQGFERPAPAGGIRSRAVVPNSEQGLGRADARAVGGRLPRRLPPPALGAQPAERPVEEDAAHRPRPRVDAAVAR